MTAPTPGLAPSQTVGPFFLNCLLRPDACRNVLVGPEAAGQHLRIEGRVLDGDGAPVPDALVEIWQANSQGCYHHPADRRVPDGRAALDTRGTALGQGFIGFGRSGTDEAGRFWFETIKPGAVPYGGARLQAPHICVLVLARGLLNHLATRLYFADEPATATDPILELVPAARRETLLARPEPGAGTGAALYRWDIILQGAGETAFFNL